MPGERKRDENGEIEYGLLAMFGFFLLFWLGATPNINFWFLIVAKVCLSLVE